MTLHWIDSTMDNGSFCWGSWSLRTSQVLDLDKNILSGMATPHPQILHMDALLIPFVSAYAFETFLTRVGLEKFSIKI